MGIFGLFGGSREKREEKRIRDLGKKSQEKYGESSLRSRALEGLRDIGTPEAIAMLLQRFTVKTEPGITDIEEKNYTIELVQGFEDKAIVPVMEFLERTESGVSWGVRCLQGLVDEEELIGAIAKILDRLSTQYARDPEKKVVLLKLLEEKKDPRISPTAAKFLDDPSDDVRLAALSTIVAQGDASQADAMVECLLDAEAPRVQAACAQALVDLRASLPEGKIEAISSALPQGFRVGKDGTLHGA